ncbi:MAG: hypothetical protein RLZZ401_530 [Pseudomonadota bacterium]|jgi:hypothetical protein
MAAACSAWAVCCATDFQWHAELGKFRYRASETSTAGHTLNREAGSLPLLRLTGRWQNQAWFADVSHGVARGEVVYEGITQIGIPLTTTSRLALSQSRARVGYLWQVSEGLEWQWSGGVERLQVDRNILPALLSLPLREVLTVSRAVVGVDGRYQPATLPRLSVSGGVALLPGLGSRLAVDSFGLYDPISLTPARHTDWRLHMTTAWQLAPNQSLTLTLQREDLRPGSSTTEIWTRNGTPAAGVRYPGSAQSLTSLSMGLAWAF